MANQEGSATVCEKCGSAVWVREITDRPQACFFLLPSQHSHSERFKLVCQRCGNELDKHNQESGKFCPLNGNLLQWRRPSRSAVNWWLRYAATHLVCFRCQTEDRSIPYDYFVGRKDGWVPQWHIVRYYGVTFSGLRGGGLWTGDILLCSHCQSKMDTETWLAQVNGLALIEAGNSDPSKISELAARVKSKFPDITLEPFPWG
ncbi:MAG TPA: hypothetical protein VLK22_01335 [Candidatus Udaeobacter sp.]|nr:hypothetical protein [Candidatus Udaeobacter sp.]